MTISLDPLLFWIPSFTTNPCPSPQEPLQLAGKLGQGLFGVVHLARSCPDARSKLRPSCLSHVQLSLGIFGRSMPGTASDLRIWATCRRQATAPWRASGPRTHFGFNRACAVRALAARTFVRSALFCAWFLVVFPQQWDKIICTPNCPIPRPSKLGAPGTRGFSIYLAAGCWRSVACGCATTSGRWPKSGKASSKQSQLSYILLTGIAA